MNFKKSIFFLIFLFVIFIVIYFIFGRYIYDIQIEKKDYGDNSFLDERKLDFIINNFYPKIALKKKNLEIADHISKIGYGFFFNNKKEFNIAKNSYDLSFYKSALPSVGKNLKANGTRYISHYKQDVFLVTGDGKISYFNSDDILKKNNIFSYIIDSNISDFANYEEFYKNSDYGVKGLLVHDDKIFLSINFQSKKDCYNTSLFVSNLNYNFLNFRKLFEPNYCVKKDNEYGSFNPHSAGGKISSFKKNKILFSSGEYLYRDLAQDKNIELGKIIEIDYEKEISKVISLGHRNIQGIGYSEDFGLIFSTEHGPKGGDEVNLNNNYDILINNYGWPVSSYGEHYGFEVRDDQSPIYKKAPLYKSHSDYGFIEPAIYFTPSIGITEIEYLKKEFIDSGFKYQFIISSLGYNSDNYSQSLTFLVGGSLEELEIFNHLTLNERIRDFEFIDDKNFFIITTESNNSFAVLKKL